MTTQTQWPVQTLAPLYTPGATPIWWDDFSTTTATQQTPLTASTGNLAAAAGTATLPAVATQTNWITGFEVTGAGATAASVVQVTVTGCSGGTMTFDVAVPAGANVGI